jgi:hypothetical protein
MMSGLLGPMLHCLGFGGRDIKMMYHVARMFTTALYLKHNSYEYYVTSIHL